jgi:ATP-dependent helicase/nuclease subunit A
MTPMTNFTPEQDAAIQPPYDRNLIMVAGAGSGKTRVLVERYLRMLEENPGWRLNDLVAVTFTQKAAQEMRDRVRQRIQQNMREAHLAGDPDAQERWATLLGKMSSARIDTLHALCGALLRANAPEAGLDPGFTVVDEIESQIMIEDAVERVLLQMVEGGDPNILALFSRYDAHRIRQELSRHAGEPPLDIPDNGSALLALWLQSWTAQAAPAFQSARNHPTYQHALSWANANRAAFPSGDILTAKWEAAHDALLQINAISPNGPITGVYGWLLTIQENAAKKSGAQAQWGKAEVAAARELLNDLVSEWVVPLMNAMGTAPDETDQEAADLAAAWGVLIRAVQRSYTLAKANDNLLDFNDLEQRAAKLLHDHPQVCERYVRQEYRHILVDEFQDTNADQWAIIQALTVPDAPLNGEPAPLFVVGDPKQSIYGFRGGDVRVFEQVRELITTLPTPDDIPAEIPLVRSFRTHRPLVNAFNYMFKCLLQRDPSSKVAEYEVEFGRPMEAHREHPPAMVPPLEIMLLDYRPRDANDVPLPDTHCNKGLIATDDLRRAEAAHIAARIRELVDSGHPVHDKETDITRPANFGDMALLFRQTTAVAIYENALREAGVPYVTVAGRGYYDRPEVWDLLALLDALYNTDDELALATALRSPLFNLSDAALYGLRLVKPKASANPTLWKALQNYKSTRIPTAEIPTVARAQEILAGLRDVAGRVTIYELLRHALARTGYLATLTGLPDGVRRRNNVLKLLQKAVESDRVTLSAFTQYLNDMTDREVREGEADTEAANAVTLITAHKSKGLEFPVVFIPDASRRGGGGARNEPLVRPATLGGITCRVPDDVGDLQQPSLYAAAKHLAQSREDAEAKRLLYVAATRARDLLFVSGFACWNGKKWGRVAGWMEMVMDVLGLETWAGLDDTLPFGNGADRFEVRVWRSPATRQGATEPPARPQTLWETNEIRSRQQLADTIHEPPLVRSVPPARDRAAYHLAASQIADLGGAIYGNEDDQRYYADKFRYSVLFGSPGHVTRAYHLGNTKRPVSQRVLGQIAHEALRWWRFPTDDNDMRDDLASYAWRHKVVEPPKIRYAVEMTHGWLKDFRQNLIYRWAEKAQQVERELPFVYRTDQRVIHGILDMLLKKSDGTWVLVDYKSSTVMGYREHIDAAERANRLLLKSHAQRYHIQVGVYAAAVLQYLASRGAQVAPEDLKVYIYYLQYAETVQVPYTSWYTALDELETQIGKLIEDDIS